MNPTLDDDLRRLHEQFDVDYSAGRRRLIEALVDRPPERPRQWRILQLAGRRFGGVAAAAAVVLVAYLVLFSNGTHGIVWAAVADQLSRIDSIVWQQQSHVSTQGYVDEDAMPDSWQRGYLKAPDLFRLEKWRATTSQPAGESPVPTFVTIWRTEQGREVRIHLHPAEKRANRWTILRNEEPRALRNVPGETWSKLQALRERDVSGLGRAQIEGVPAVGFEAPLQAYEPGIPDPDGTIRVWVHERTAVPVRIELRFRKDEQYFTTLITKIEWNVPLSLALFEVPDEEGWDIEHEVVESQATRSISGRLKPGVTLRITAPTGEVILSEEHIDLVAMSCPDGEDRHRRALEATLTPEGERRLVEYTTAHIGQTVTIVFDGEVVGRPRIQAPLRKVFRIDFGELGPTLDEFAGLIMELE